MIQIRELVEADSLTMATAFAQQGWNKPAAQFDGYWRESQAGQRDVLIAVWEGQFAGYVTVVWQSDYPPFRQARIPEIVDLNVLQKYQRRGIASALLDEAERRIARYAGQAGLGVGLFSDYGRAQILYVKRGYVPDGRGIWGHGRWLSYGDVLTLDDDVALYFTKIVPEQPGKRQSFL